MIDAPDVALLVLVCGQFNMIPLVVKINSWRKQIFLYIIMYVTCIHVSNELYFTADKEEGVTMKKSSIKKVHDPRREARVFRRIVHFAFTRHSSKV